MAYICVEIKIKMHDPVASFIHFHILCPGLATIAVSFVVNWELCYQLFLGKVDYSSTGWRIIFWLISIFVSMLVLW